MILKDINNFSSVMRPHQKGKANVMAFGSLIESLNGYSAFNKKAMTTGSLYYLSL